MIIPNDPIELIKSVVLTPDIKPNHRLDNFNSNNKIVESNTIKIKSDYFDYLLTTDRKGNR